MEIGRRGIVRAAPDRKASQSVYSASFSPFPSAICTPGLFLPSRPPRKGCCALFPSTRSVRACRNEALRARTMVRVQVKSLWKILTFLLDVAISNANYKNRPLIRLRRRQEPRADVCLGGRDYAICKSDRLRQIAFITENGEKMHDIREIIGVHRYDSVISTRTTRRTPKGTLQRGSEREDEGRKRREERKRENE